MDNVPDLYQHAPNFGISLVSGAIAGLAVDISLFPLDTIKTRLQSREGFLKAGGFHKIYSGLGSVAIGSSPGAAVFFCTYEMVKSTLSKSSPEKYNNLILYMSAASCGEMASCIVRVPTELIKQRTQANYHFSSLHIFKTILKREGIQGLYRGYFSTVLREIPFSFIQFPLWEYLKMFWISKQGFDVHPWQSSLCGAIAGSIAATLTTPIDVVKTRIMLAEDKISIKGNIFNVIKYIWVEKGFSGYFAGLIPRVLWISIGGAIFLGAYEKSRYMFNVYLYK